MQKHLEATLCGPKDYGMFLAILCDLFDGFVSGVDSRELRTIEVILNDYFSLKYDFVKEVIIDKDGNEISIKGEK